MLRHEAFQLKVQQQFKHYLGAESRLFNNGVDMQPICLFKTMKNRFNISRFRFDQIFVKRNERLSRGFRVDAHSFCSIRNELRRQLLDYIFDAFDQSRTFSY